jgi:predicted alpha/beta-fold hydrolase
MLTADPGPTSPQKIAGTFKPAWWLPGGHLQTLWPALLRRPIPLMVRRERFNLPDGDFIDVDWVGEQGPIVVVLHGLGGSVTSQYARGILRVIALRGWRGVLMHFRGCSGEPNRLPRSYHAGDTGDLDTFIAALRVREPHTSLAAVGYSLGGNVLLKWLGEQGEAAPIVSAVAVSVPFDLDNATTRLRQGFSRLYDRHILRGLKASLNQKCRRMAMPWDRRVIAAIKTLRQFDDRVTAPLHGFHSADDYYARATCRPYLRRITVPTLVIHAVDDPFMSPRVVPPDGEFAQATSLELTAHGGHVGFVGGEPWAPYYWLESRIPDFIAGQASWQ